MHAQMFRTALVRTVWSELHTNRLLELEGHLRQHAHVRKDSDCDEREDWPQTQEPFAAPVRLRSS